MAVVRIQDAGDDAVDDAEDDADGEAGETHVGPDDGIAPEAGNNPTE